MNANHILTLGLSLSISVLTQGQQKPNIVFYITDDLGVSDVSIYGAGDVRTPQLERMAELGMTFDNAFIASPACGPSRAALLTGKMPARNGAEANHTYPAKDIELLTPFLQDNGYEIAAFGKVAHGKMNHECGFDFYSPPNINLANNVSEYLGKRTSEKPLVLLVGDRRPHVPWTDEIIYTTEEVSLPDYFIDTHETREHRAMYYSDVTGLDDEMGKVYDMAKQEFGENFIFMTF